MGKETEKKLLRGSTTTRYCEEQYDHCSVFTPQLKLWKTTEKRVLSKQGLVKCMNHDYL